jgi:hypothetical protein
MDGEFERAMDPLFGLSNHLRRYAQHLAATSEPGFDPPRIEDWLRFWNDEDTDLGNLRNFEHWLGRSRP